MVAYFFLTMHNLTSGTSAIVWTPTHQVQTHCSAHTPSLVSNQTMCMCVALVWKCPYTCSLVGTNSAILLAEQAAPFPQSLQIVILPMSQTVCSPSQLFCSKPMDVFLGTAHPSLSSLHAPKRTLLPHKFQNQLYLAVTG